MKKENLVAWGRVFLVCIMCVAVGLCSIQKTRVQSKSFTIFPDSCEYFLAVCYDGRSFLFTTHEMYCLHINFDDIEKGLRKEGERMENISLILHNHIIDPALSVGDAWLLNSLVKVYHFRGYFGVIATQSKKIGLWRYDQEPIVVRD